MDSPLSPAARVAARVVFAGLPPAWLSTVDSSSSLEDDDDDDEALDGYDEDPSGARAASEPPARPPARPRRSSAGACHRPGGSGTGRAKAPSRRSAAWRSRWVSRGRRTTPSRNATRTASTEKRPGRSSPRATCRRSSEKLRAPRDAAHALSSFHAARPERRAAVSAAARKPPSLVSLC